MTGFSYSISPEIFQMYPGYVRGVVIAHGVRNGPSPDELVGMLRQAEESVRSRLAIEKITEEPRIAAWREAYRKFGAKPGEYRSSVEAMARRALRNESLPSINALVEIGNLLSLRYLMPVGGHAIDLLKGDISLRLASGEEEFVAFGTTELEHPLPGEVIFAEGNTVLTRRWTWRQAQHTLTLPETTAIEFNVDGLPPVEAEEVKQACAEVVELVQRFCGGKARVGMLLEGNPTISLTG
ncbi:MAG: phenylalanine--tRNA ligase beta subunit-related protein [Chloroflexota bacterium]